MSKLTLPNGQEVELHDLGWRQLLVPVGTSITVPATHEWTILGMVIPPVRDYVPPVGSETRDAQKWGDVQIRLEGAEHAQSRSSVLTLMDRYWGRCNLCPEWPEVAAKLAHAQHAVVTAPKITELFAALEHARYALQEYLGTADSPFPVPVTVTGERRFTVEHVGCENASEPHLVRPLDVELRVVLKRPVS